MISRPAIGLLGLLCVVTVTIAGERTDAGEHPPAMLEADSPLDRIVQEEQILSEGSITFVPTVRFRFPLLRNDWWGATAYVDLDPTTGELDYQCTGTTYDTHNANDFAIRDFYEQDEGRYVVAAAPGTVTETQDGFFDKQTSGAPASANVVVLEHADGSQTQYQHLRKWSVLVAPGQEIFEGQTLGMVGSSGASTGSHLHFSIYEGGNFHEPHAGACRSGDPLWKSQPPHIREEPLEMFWMGMSTIDPGNGRFKHRPPDVHHVQQNATSNPHYFWFRLKACQATDIFRMIYRDPGGSVFRDEFGSCGQFYARVFGRYTTYLPTSGSQGTWSIEFSLNGISQGTLYFEYDGVPYEAPVGHGRTVPVVHGTAGGELRGSDADAGLEEFRIVTPPAHGQATLAGPRQRYFSYTPESGYAGPDSFTFEVEDGQGLVSTPATMLLDVSPVTANVLRLHGEDDHVAVSDNGSLNLDTGLTLEAWVRRTGGSAGWNVLFDRRNPDNTTGFSFGIQPDSTLRFQMGNGSTAAYAYGATPIPMDRWTHVAATWDGAAMRIYVNGVLDGAAEPFTGPPSYPGAYETWLGRSRSAGNSFRGEIDEMRIWAVSRSESQLRSGTGCSFYEGAVPATLRGWWTFDGDTADRSTFGNDGSPILQAHLRRSEGTAPLDCAGLDTDGDGVGDLPDNCPLTANTDQADAEGDGIGDACDLCPGETWPQQADTDRDGVGDACDLCPFMADTEQSDSDGDGTGDLCDPVASDAATGVPSANISLALAHDSGTGVTTLSWNAESLAAAYEVYRGNPEEIRNRFYGTCLSASDPDPTDTSFQDTETPATGEFWGYLVIGAGATGAQGLAGIDSDGRQRDLRGRDCL